MIKLGQAILEPGAIFPQMILVAIEEGPRKVSVPVKSLKGEQVCLLELDTVNRQCEARHGCIGKRL